MNQFFRLVYFLKYAKKETAIRILLGLGIVGAQFSQTWFLAKMVIAVCEKRDMKEILLCFLAEFLYVPPGSDGRSSASFYVGGDGNCTAYIYAGSIGCNGTVLERICTVKCTVYR